ncbi:hypothetical protein AB7C87_21955 [Natrarchaeobius sp. A-rgal3]|uniref:hypothetical protein n=1 Tax=Natrarchaeobius versutus TaxID=1679078 RepID=UPI00350F9EFD
MKRRTALIGTGLAATTALAGCLDSVPGIARDTEFEEVDAELAIEDPPNVTVDDGTVIVEGTIQYGSSSCGTVELAHTEYGERERRLDLLIVAETEPSWLPRGCTDDLVETGYRVEVPASDSLHFVAVTEHHVFGEAYSTTLDVTE